MKIWSWAFTAGEMKLDARSWSFYFQVVEIEVPEHFANILDLNFRLKLGLVSFVQKLSFKT